ncbi:MAG: ABC transporter ATP-binding protein [Caldilineaceae bacterium]
MTQPIQALAQSTKAPAPVQIDELSMYFGSVCAVDKVSLAIAGGEFMTFLGPSGSGKTTILKIIAGFLTQTAGEVRIDGAVMRRPPHQRDIGMVFQNYALFPHMTAAQNTEFPLKMRGIAARVRAARVREALAMVHLEAFGERYPKQLSGGQQQRVALARALIAQPRVVLMDEPLGALDKKLRDTLQLEIRRLQQALGITMIYVTHDQEEALVMSDRIAIFNHGRLEQVGTGAALYERPGSRFVAEFIGQSNLFEGEVQDGIFYSGAYSFRVNDNTPSLRQAVLVVRPERMQLRRPQAAVPAHCNALPATVDDILYLGSDLKYELVSHDKTLSVRHPVGTQEQPFQRGDQVVVTWAIADGVIIAV